MRKIRVSSAIGITVLLFALMLSLVAWPFGKIKHTEKSGHHDKVTGMTETIDLRNRAQQTFVPQYKNLQSVSIYVANELPEDNSAALTVIFFDKNLDVISQENISLSGTEYPGYVEIPTEVISFVVGESYYYLVSATNDEVCLAYTDSADTGAEESLETYYAEKLQEDRSLLTVYQYDAPFDWVDALLLALLWLVCSIILTILFECVFRVCGWNYTVALTQVLRIDATVITAVISLTAFIAIGPMQMFTKSIVNILVYEIGVILFALTCLYLIYKKPEGERKTLPEGIFARVEVATDYIQKFAFAGAILACCHYGNALYTEGQEAASAWIFGCFTVAIVVCFVMGICRILLDKKKNKKRRIRFSVGYATLTALVFTLLILCRNNRDWAFKAVIPFMVFYIGFVFACDSKKIMKNLIDGIIISFVLMLAYCLVHRPYHYYRYNRYPMLFHTVTVTGMYLILVISAAFSKFLAEGKKHMVILGISLSYLFLAVSRIGMITMLFVFVFMTVFTVFFEQARELDVKQKLLVTLKDSAKRLGWIAVSVLWCLPICFTATRVLPAVAMQPERTELEEFALMITEETPMDSDLYMTFPKFLNLTLNRISTSADEITWEDLFKRKEEEVSLSANTVSANMTATAANKTASTGGATSHNNEEYIDAESAYEEENKKDYSNGRTDIWKLYLSKLNLDGHLTMQIEKEIAHAHNTFLQSAYDHGMIFGVLFLLFCIASGCKAIHYYFARKNHDVYAAFPLIIMLAFGMTSMVEWVFHPCIPLGFVFLAVLAPLIKQPLQKGRGKRAVKVYRSHNE